MTEFLFYIQVSIIGKLLNQLTTQRSRSRGTLWPRLDDEVSSSAVTTPSTAAVSSADPFKMPDAPELK